MMATTQTPADLLRDLRDNYKREREAAALYRRFAAREQNPAKKKILLAMAEAEERHASRWADRLRELGSRIPEHKMGMGTRLRLRVVGWLGMQAALRRQEAAEERDVAIYERQRHDHSERIGDILEEVQRDEQRHSRLLRLLHEQVGPQAVLDVMLRRERWHRAGQGWIGDAIYGVNDGLGAVFGLVSGVAGYTRISHWILVSGLAGTIASALSMAAGAYLAAKSSQEVAEAEMAREQREFEEKPEEEREELELIYQLKGFTVEEARLLVNRLSANPEQFVKTMAAEELGISETATSRPGVAALSAGISTAVGAIVPVLPFFWLDGVTAIAVAAVVSLAAHFLVGAGKSLITIRSWWTSGLEMMGVGALEGVVTYGLGLLAGKLL